MNKILIIILIHSLALAQESTTLKRLKNILKKDVQGSQSIYNNYKNSDARIKNNIEKYRNELKKNDVLLAALKKQYSNYENNLKDFHSLAQEELSSLSFFHKIGSKKKRMLECLVDNTKNQNSPSFSKCQKSSGYKLSKLDKLTPFYKTLANSKEKIASHIEKVKKEQSGLIAAIETRKTALDQSKLEKQKASRDMTLNTRELEYAQSLSEKDLKCGNQLETIDLENKKISKSSKINGPFYGVPRDHQDGLGTCFANTARNLLISASKNKLNPSFLDLALQFKIQENDFSQGIDAGNSCKVIKAATQVGICDKSLSPTENAQLNPVVEGLTSKEKLSISAQANVLEAIQSFLIGNKNTKDKFKEIFKSSPHDIISKIKNNSDITLPLPMVSNTMAQEPKTGALFYLRHPDSNDLYDKFKAQLNELDIKFQNQYIKLALNNATKEEIVAAYKDDFIEILKEYSMEDDYPKIEKWYLKRYNMKTRKGDMEKLKKTITFLDSLMKKEVLNSDQYYCLKRKDEGINYLSSILPLAKYMDKNDIDEASIFNDQDNIKNEAEILQLAIAPSCLNPSNRQKIEKNYHCRDERGVVLKLKKEFKGEELYDAFRVKIRNKLSKGLALGNSFDVSGQVSGHINTIVGQRYNPKSKNCEYKIRESMDAKSHWKSEKFIIDKIRNLTEVDAI